MEAVNDNLLCIAAQMLVDARGDDDFGVAEQMLYNMLAQRQTKRNIDSLNKIRPAKSI